MSTQKPCVVGYLKTDNFTPTGSPYGDNQQPAAGSVAADVSTFFSATPATDNTPGGVASFMFLQENTDATVISKVLPRNFIIKGIRALKTGGNGAAGDLATISKVSADGLTTSLIYDLSLQVNEKVFALEDKLTAKANWTVNLAAGETLKVTATKGAGGNCQATVYVDVIGA